MFSRLRRRLDARDEGFTLIELLVVIIIIGILAAIAIPVFLSQRTKGYEASMKQDLRTVAQEISASNVDLQNYTLVPFGGGTKTMGTTPGTLTSASANSVGDSTAVKLSSGNSIAVGTVSASAFCIQATHTGANTWKYDSNAGGLVKGIC